MKTPFLIAVCSVALVSACASPGSRERVSGGYDYLEVEQQDETITIPENLDPPKRSSQYAVPRLQTSTKPLVGSAVKISSPRLVLPLVSGSHVEEGSEDAKVLFDQINDNEALDKTIWDRVLGYLEQNNIGVDKFDRENNTLVTDWVISTIEKESSWYEITTAYEEQAKKFKLSLEVAPHGRTAALTNEIVAYIDENGDAALSALGPIEKRNNEVDFINFIIAEYDFGLRLERTQRIAKIRDGFTSELGFNPDGDSAILIDAEYNDAWPRLLLVLRTMGFDVVDLDQSSGIMFVNYDGQDTGWFGGLFSDDGLSLEQTDYRIFIKNLGARTSVTFKTNQNEAFTAQQVSDIFPVFSEYMASDNLDL